jgi:hypothetical protein
MTVYRNCETNDIGSVVRLWCGEFRIGSRKGQCAIVAVERNCGGDWDVCGCAEICDCAMLTGCVDSVS